MFIDQPPVFRLVAPNLTRGREGRRPDGGTIDPRYMPIGMTSHLTDEEILAIWRYRRTLPPKTVGGR
ncbi:MAG TPA: hypothetical protein VNK43_11535 [Gemmatimonadales bacterium]|nr:hypothetical protein [Gemmatimonadales bacterium]